MISIHALREEGDTSQIAFRTVPYRFLSTPSARRATCSHGCRYCFAQFLSTPSARRATGAHVDKGKGLHISIHALREEGDTTFSTAPDSFMNFYPRPPRGGRLDVRVRFLRLPVISIHALREEGDALSSVMGTPMNEFLSTPSARRATESPSGRRLGQGISIHALREEGDCGAQRHCSASIISIHALREEGDLFPCIMPDHIYRFLSTPSARRATECSGHPMRNFHISIHALREEGDPRPWRCS